MRTVVDGAGAGSEAGLCGGLVGPACGSVLSPGSLAPGQREFSSHSWAFRLQQPLAAPPPMHPVFPSSCSGSTDQAGLEAAPSATREKIRSRFHGSHDLIHRLFVCISGAWLGLGQAAPGGGRDAGDARPRESGGFPTVSFLHLQPRGGEEGLIPQQVPQLGLGNPRLPRGPRLPTRGGSAQFVVQTLVYPT